MQSSDLRPLLEDTARTGVRVVGLRVTGYAIGFVASVLIARALGPTGRGLYAFPVALAGIVMILGTLGLEQANIHLAGLRSSLGELWSNCTVVSLFVAVATWLTIGTAYVVGGRGLFAGLPPLWISIPIIQVPLMLQSLYWFNLLQLSGRVLPAVRAAVVGIAGHAIVCAMLFALGELTPFRVLALTFVTSGTTWALLLLLSVRAGLVSAVPNASSLRRGLVFGIKAYAGVIFMFLVLRVDQILVQGILGFRALGLYALAVTLAEPIWLLSDPFALSSLPHQVRAAEGDDRRLSFATARLSLLVAFAAGALAWAVAPYAIQLVYGPRFVGSVWPFRLLLPGMVAIAVYRPLASLLLKEGKASLLAAFGLFALAVNFGSNLALLPSVGVGGASIASTITYVALAVACIVAVRRPGLAGWADLRPRASDIARLVRAVRA